MQDSGLKGQRYVTEKTRTAEKAAELKHRLAAWRSSVGAQLPTPNPKYDPARANQAAKGKNK